MTQPAPPFNPYGTDFFIGGNPLDFDASFRLVTGRALLSQNLACRFSIGRGAVIDCPNDGLDLRDMVSQGLTQSQLNQLPSAIKNEALKDQRVQDAAVSVKFSFEMSKLIVVMSVTSLYGPFKLTLAVTNVTVAILDANLPTTT